MDTLAWANSIDKGCKLKEMIAGETEHTDVCAESLNTDDTKEPKAGLDQK
jgi:hypothetical protein